MPAKICHYRRNRCIKDILRLSTDVSQGRAKKKGGRMIKEERNECMKGGRIIVRSSGILFNIIHANKNQVADQIIKMK